MTWHVADGHKWSGHMFRGPRQGRGTGYTALPCGCEVHVYGARTDAERAELEALLAAMESAVREAEPNAEIQVFRTTHNETMAGAVVATVTADAVAAIHMGPTHRAAIGRIRICLNHSTDVWMRR